MKRRSMTVMTDSKGVKSGIEFNHLAQKGEGCESMAEKGKGIVAIVGVSWGEWKRINAQSAEKNTGFNPLTLLVGGWPAASQKEKRKKTPKCEED